MFRTFLASLLALGCSACFADAAPDASRVIVPVLVTTDHGAPVAGLVKENFRLFEDGKEQQITDFGVEHGPVSLGILVDTSGSMTKSFASVAHGVASLLSDEVRGDEAFLIEFAAAAQVTVPFTGDEEKIIQQTLHERPLGRTCLLDAIDLGLRELQRARNPRRAIVVFSDGGDNSSHSSERELRKSLAGSDVRLFVIGFFRQPSNRSPSREELEGPHLLQELAQETGGGLYWPERPDALVRLGHLVATELHTRYVLSYSPARSRNDGKTHIIRIKLTSPRGVGKLEASFRQTTR